MEIEAEYSLTGEDTSQHGEASGKDKYKDEKGVEKEKQHDEGSSGSFWK